MNSGRWRTRIGVIATPPNMVVKGEFGQIAHEGSSVHAARLGRPEGLAALAKMGIPATPGYGCLTDQSWSNTPDFSTKIPSIRLGLKLKSGHYNVLNRIKTAAGPVWDRAGRYAYIGGFLDANQIKLVQSSWSKVLPISEKAAELFYNRLFEIDPSTKVLFKGDMKEQGRKLMEMITAAVNGLNDLDGLVPVVQDLGRRHGGYGVQEKHYGSVGSALLWTLDQGLGDAFTTEVRNAWTETYALLSGVMKDASAKVA